ncbi:MAG: hypothetical protein K0B87_03615 [Candidatus Syntrophosphaera sp.]|nr:hypothetical protein [Candidatus Syntrophosphaera sp.]
MISNRILGFMVAAVILSAVGCAMITGRSMQHDTVEEECLNEASGLAASLKTPGLLYTHNDSGGKAVVYILNYRALMPSKIVLEGIKNRDWEDIAVGVDPLDGKSYVFVGDIGDNAASYTTSFIYRFAEPAIDDTLITVSRIDRIEYAYEDGPRDAEALFADPLTGDLYVISKRDASAGVYRLAYPQSYSLLNVAQKVARLPYNWVTAADICPAGKYILVKTYTSVYRYKRSPKMSVAEALGRKYRSMPYKLEGQGEAVAWDHNGKGYFTLSERLGDTPLELYYYK